MVGHLHTQIGLCRVHMLVESLSHQVESLSRLVKAPSEALGRRAGALRH